MDRRQADPELYRELPAEQGRRSRGADQRHDRGIQPATLRPGARALHGGQEPAGDQLRVYNGLYLTNSKLGARREAEDAFIGLVDYGLETNRLGVKFLFRPGSTGFAFEGNSHYVMWLRDIAGEADRSKACLEVTGHTSATGSAAINERLSLLRAEYIKVRLTQYAPALGPRMIANGVGSRENLVGTGVDNDSDALDRRVEFKVIPSCT